MKWRRLVIVDGVRTPFCKSGSDLSTVSADELGRIVVNALLTRTGLDPALIDEVIFGCVAQPARTANIARVIALRAGIPAKVPAVTVHRNCASGCESLTQAYEKMIAGHGSIFIVGGAESMSQIPMVFKSATAKKLMQLGRARTLGERLHRLANFRIKDFEPRIGLQMGLTDPISGLNMGQTAEVLAREFRISREQQDAFALESHQRALAAQGRLAKEICPVYLPGAKPNAVVQHDNGPRKHQSLEMLAKLPTVFDRKNGTVTAGNSSQITDGAAALLVMSESKAYELGFTPLGALTGYAYAGCDPAHMGLGPVFAIAKAEAELGLRLERADLVEINEAFAAQVLAVLKCMRSEEFARRQLGRNRPLGKVPSDHLNVNGGAIALGHPVGVSGTRLVLSSLKELERRNLKRALVSVCVGGGQGAALWLERL